ncbi:MAG: ACP S-malonyltransferase [Oscillospiraceae bacterium]|nr:ACP S-malonyltransferase [Oscillospiraceae bacterium]
MSTIAFVYPGQGAQRPGMGRALYERYSPARDAFALADDVLGLDTKTLCFETEEAVLARTEHAQVALFVVSMAAHRVLLSFGLAPAAVAGFSLGECTALCAAGFLTWEDGLRLVRARARAMQRAADDRGGAMAAVLGLTWDTVEAICREAGGGARAVNDNAPGQAVIAGAPDAVADVGRRCREAGAVKVVPLALSAAFHTPDMARAAETLRAAAADLTVHPPRLPLYTNVTGVRLPDDIDLPAHMAAQMCSPVRWQGCVRSLAAAGADTFVEVGEGRTLLGLIKRIDRTRRLLPTTAPTDIEALRALAPGGA